MLNEFIFPEEEDADDDEIEKLEDLELNQQQSNLEQTYGRSLLKLCCKRLTRSSEVGRDHWDSMKANICEIVRQAEADGVPGEKVVNATNRNKKTALMHLSQLTDDTDLISCLIRLKADPRLNTNRG